MLKVKIYDNDNDQNSGFFKDAGRSWLAFSFGKTKLHTYIETKSTTTKKGHKIPPPYNKTI